MNSLCDPLSLLTLSNEERLVCCKSLVGFTNQERHGTLFCRCLAVNQVLFDLRRSQVTGSPASFRGTIGELFGPVSFSIAR